MTVAAKGNKYIVGALREVAMGNVAFQYGTEENGTPEIQIEKDLNKP